jgi:L-threonylcarbamoyladenylate synthase
MKKKLSEAIEALKRGEIIVYPTDTQYALGADIFNIDAIKKIFQLKNRPYDLPISIAVEKLDVINKYAIETEHSEKICKHFLPGKLTIILYKKDVISDLLTGYSEKIAIRIPDNKIALELLHNFGPLTITSANMHGKKTNGEIELIHSEFKDKISCYLNYEILNNNPSTIVDLTNTKPIIIREGDISLKDILAVI